MKNFRLKSAIPALLMSLLFVFSCTDKEEDQLPEPINTASITIISPTAESVVMPNDTVSITGTISCTKTMHGYKLIVRRTADNSELLRKGFHDHKTALDFDYKWSVGEGIKPGENLELEVITSLDHDGNTASKKVTFQTKQ